MEPHFPEVVDFSLPNPGIEPLSPALQADSLSSEPPGKSMELGNGKEMWVEFFPIKMNSKH